MSTKGIYILIFLVLGLGGGEGKTYVGVSPFTPFIFCNISYIGNGSEVQGLSYLMFQAINAELNDTTPEDFEFYCLEWGEMMEATYNGTLNYSISGITIGFARMQKGFQFSYRTFDSALSVLLKSKTNRFHFLESMEVYLGLFLVGFIIIIGTVLYFVENTNEGLFYYIGHSFAQFFFIIDLSIKTLFGRIIQFFFWFAILILVSSYTAITADNMIADKRIKLGIHNSELYGKRLAVGIVYKRVMEAYGVICVPYIGNILQPEDAGEFMEENNLDGLLLDDAVAKMFYYYDCSLFFPIRNFNECGFGMLFGPNISHDYIQPYNRVITKINEETDFIKDNLQKTISNHFEECHDNPDQQYFRDAEGKITFRYVSGLWIILGGAILLGTIVFICSIFYRRYNKRNNPDIFIYKGPTSINDAKITKSIINEIEEAFKELEEELKEEIEETREYILLTKQKYQLDFQLLFKNPEFRKYMINKQKDENYMKNKLQRK